MVIGDGIGGNGNGETPTHLTGGAMVRRAFGQRSVFEVLLPDGEKLWDPVLRQIDQVLDDEGLIDQIAEVLGQ